LHIEAEVCLGSNLFDSNSFSIGCLSGGLHESECGFEDRFQNPDLKMKR